MSKVAGHGARLRLITAFTLIPVVTVIVWAPVLRFAFVLLVMALAAAGANEFRRMCEGVGIATAGRWMSALSAALAFGAYALPGYGITPADLLLPALLALALIHMFSLKHTIAGLSASVCCLLYTGYCATFFVTLHSIPEIGPGLITLLVFSIGCSDTGAYVVGKALGRHKLAPRVSPNKTVEGSVAALVCGVLSAMLLHTMKVRWPGLGFPDWSLTVYLCAGLVLSITGQLGDLTESLMKRDAGIKDSGTLFPGHGGALDRCDAFLFGGPTLFLLLKLFGV